MNSKQKQGEKAKLADEKKVLEDLKKQYRKAALDVQRKIRIHSGKINALLADWDNLDDNQKSQLQSQIYQKQYQESLAKQLDEILDNMDSNQYDTVSEYLNGCYESGFLASMYDLHGQGIPIITPIDQKAVTRAVTLDAKISKKLYGGYVEEMKRNIRSEISRGIATNSAFAVMARNLTNATNTGFNRTMRIVRTEGHRIQVEAANDAQHKAKDAGADILKQWDSTLDDRTRDSHRRVDGELRELDEKFSNGLRMPGDSAGGAGEVVNCRCALLQRARWALDNDELETLKDRAQYYGLDKTANFDEFKRKYLKIKNPLENPQKSSTMASGAVSGARNPFGDKAKEHAEKYYGLVRSMKTDVAKIAATTGMSEEEIQDVKNFIFFEKHDLGGAELERFAPDFMMAESWRRLSDGKPERHDITMLKHEILEKSLIKKGLSQEEAHLQASRKHNYSKEAGEYYAKIKKFKKE